ncbi:MAG: hypothetical protein C0476_08830 [Sphingomonas sp.]|nr:hypothetical protein [Sphingomonas sp.]
MIEMIEQCLTSELDTASTASEALNVAIYDLVAAIGFDAGEYWTLSVFEIDLAEDEAFRIAAGWADRAGAESDGRSWRKGEGYTGTAWSDDAEVIEGNTSDRRVQRRFSVPNAKARSYDLDRYRSVVCIPIRTGSGTDRRIWGIVTATSNKVDRFKDEAPGTELQAVDMVRDVARMMALLAITDKFSEHDDIIESD